MSIQKGDQKRESQSEDTSNGQVCQVTQEMVESAVGAFNDWESEHYSIEEWGISQTALRLLVRRMLENALSLAR